MEKKSTPDKKATSKKEVIQMLSHTQISDWWGRGKWKNLYQHLDSASLVFFRVAFGLILLVEVYRYFAKNWIDNFFINPSFHFHYWPFHWLESLEAPLMYYFFYLIAVLSIFVMIGLFYRISMILIFLGISYIFLLEATLYLNHLYLVVLFCFLLIFIPLNRSNSVDNLIFKKEKSNSTTPAWCLWLIRFMVAVPYFFGGIAKLSPDWLRGEPMRNWLKSGMQVPESFKAFDPDFLGYFLCYSGLLLDLFIVPALLYKKTRPYAYVVILLFHLTNAFMFQIGIFPWFMIAATLLFFEPNWPRVLWNKLTKKRQWKIKLHKKSKTLAPQKLSLQQKGWLAFLTIWVAFQVLMPLRHWVIPGDVNWTGEGHRYSWRMKLLTKHAEGTFYIVNKETGEVAIALDPMEVIPQWQANRVLPRPRFIWQFAQIAEEEYRSRGKEIEFKADIRSSLNGRPYQQLIDPNVDLLSQPRPLWGHASWILPLTTPLPK